MTPLARIFVFAGVGLHLGLTLVCSFGLIGLEYPMISGIVLMAYVVVADRSIFFIYPAFLLATLVFLVPLVFFDTRIASYSFRGDDVYDRGMLRALYFFVGMFAFYIFTTPRIVTLDIRQNTLARTDAAPVIASAILVVFAALTVREGTLFSGNYNEVSANRLSFIEFASVFTLLGFCCARSPYARRLLIIAASIYLISCLLVGLRLRFLSVFLVIVCCTWGMRLSDRWKVVGLCLALVLFSIGFIRATGFSAATHSWEIYMFLLFGREEVVSTFGGAFQTAKFYAFYIDTLASMQGLSGAYFLIGDILSIFITRGFTPADIEIKTITQTYFAVPGGGLLPGYFFAYFGLAGSVILSAIFVAIFCGILRLSNPIFLPWKILLLAYAPRMLLYDWVVAFKMMFFFAIAAGLIRLIANAQQLHRPGSAGLHIPGE